MQRTETKPMIVHGATLRNREQAKGKLFEVGFKGYYRDTSEYFTEHIRANTETEALGKFCRRKSIGIAEQTENMQWWEDEWLMSFRYIREVITIPCPHCDGSGTTTSLPQ